MVHRMSKVESHLEIERKFLVNEADFSGVEGIRLTTVETVYLDVEAMSKIDPSLAEVGKEREIRVSKRVKDDGTIKYKSTSKTGGAALVREEAEVEIDEESFNQAVEKFGIARLTKKRFTFEYLRKRFDLDILDDKLAVLEVELEHEREPVVLPPFVNIKREVTGDPDYYNANIAKPLENVKLKEELV